jgi:hypothetical protein
VVPRFWVSFVSICDGFGFLSDFGFFTVSTHAFRPGILPFHPVRTTFRPKPISSTPGCGILAPERPNADQRRAVNRKKNMKTIKTLALAGALGLGMASGALYAQDTAGEGNLPGGPRFGPPKEILEKYDVNKDGKLDETERAALHQDIVDGKIQPPPFRPGRHGMRPTPPNAKEVIAKFDTDKDGKLDEAELAAFFAAHRPPMPPGPGPDAPQPPDAAPEPPQQ